MYKCLSKTLPIDCMGIRIANPLIPREFHNPNPLDNRYIPGYVQVEEIFYPLNTETLTQPDWALRGYFQRMSWPQKPIFWIDNQGSDILWVNAHPSEGDCGKDFKFPHPKWMYGYRDKYCTYLMQVTSAEYLPREFPHGVNINTLPNKQESLETELYY